MSYLDYRRLALSSFYTHCALKAGDVAVEVVVAVAAAVVVVPCLRCSKGPSPAHGFPRYMAPSEIADSGSR